MTIKEFLLPIILAVIGSSWFGSWISSLDSKKAIISRIDAIEAKIDANEKKQEEKDAEHLRSKILRFDDELRMHIKHSKEYFDDVIKDITHYERYCKSNPDFVNRKAESAIKHIIKAYDECFEQNDFL